MGDSKDNIEQFFVKMPDDHEPGQWMEARTLDGQVVKFKVPRLAEPGISFPVAYTPGGRGGDSPVDTNLMMAMETTLKKFGVSRNKASDLLCLTRYDIILIADDSGSMRKQDPGCTKTRWEEQEESLKLVVSIGGCFDEDGLDIYFLNRAKVQNVSRPDDDNLKKALAEVPFDGGTKLSDALEAVISDRERAVKLEPDLAEKPVLLMIFTDGKPDEGPTEFGIYLRDVLQKERTALTFHCQILPCTGKDADVAWIKTLDAELEGLDVTDDYETERKQLGLSSFTRGDWCMKAMLGAVDAKWDDPVEQTPALDAPVEQPQSSPTTAAGSNSNTSAGSKSNLSSCGKWVLTMTVLVGVAYVYISLRELNNISIEL